MPRFFLHVRNGNDLAEDLEGQDLVGLGAAHEEALVAAREIMSDRVLAGKQPNHSQIEITDEAGRLVETVHFADALKAG